MSTIYTYQDLLAVGEREDDRMAFIMKAISNHQAKNDYTTAINAREYMAKRNPGILNFSKMIYTITGAKVKDPTGDGYKICSADFPFLVNQRNQFLLSNGISFGKDDTKRKLGKNFDTVLQDAGEAAMVDKVSFLFWNFDHIEFFKYIEFVPLYDEETGALKAGIRFWQIASDKPFRATLYELDGYTDYIWENETEDIGSVLHEKVSYKVRVTVNPADGMEIKEFENYDSFPIVPLWANKQKQSELIGMKEKIDCYDLIMSGFANTIEEASYIYWSIENAGGMMQEDLVRFIEQMKTIHAATTGDADGAKATANSIEAPFSGREAILSRLKEDIYRDFGGFDPRSIVSGATVTAQIRAAQKPLDQMADAYEYCVNKAIKAILAIIGIDDEPTFSRSYMTNTTEEVSTLLQAAQYLPQDYITKKILYLFGDGDLTDQILEQMDEEADARFEEENAGESEALEEYGNEVLSMLDDLMKEVE